MTRGGLMADDELEAELIEGGIERVDVLVTQNHGVSELTIALEECLAGASQRTLVERQHFEELGTNEVHVVLQHGFEVRLRGRRQGLLPFQGEYKFYYRSLTRPCWKRQCYMIPPYDQHRFPLPPVVPGGDVCHGARSRCFLRQEAESRHRRLRRTRHTGGRQPAHRQRECRTGGDGGHLRRRA